VSAGGRADGASEQALADAVREEVLKSVWANRRGLLERLQQDLGRGEYAAAGVDDVIAALRQAQVDTLLIAADGGPDGVGWFGEDGTELGRSEQDVRDLGVEQPRSDQLDEVLVRAAAGTGASVVVTPDAHAALRDGVAALLRY
jgi:stalled ribosome rescue protein Dom34